jgi:hypothetical protein
VSLGGIVRDKCIVDLGKEPQISARSSRARGRTTTVDIYLADARREVRRLRPSRFISAALQGRAGPLSKPSRMSRRNCSSLSDCNSSWASMIRNASRTTSLAELYRPEDTLRRTNSSNCGVRLTLRGIVSSDEFRCQNDAIGKDCQ